jgi:8-oxo-dGTP pyrophosphatase MutT (NUDIX family)
MSGLMRHVDAVCNVTLLGDRLEFRLGDQAVGWVPDSAAELLTSAHFGCEHDGNAIVLPNAADLPFLARCLADVGRTSWFGEAFDVRAQFDGPVLTTVDRGALPFFGIRAEGVHVNGFIRRADGPYLWIARRAADRKMDPGKLDHLFAGGIPAGLDAETTLFKEGMEEAGLKPDVVDRAEYVGSLRYCMLRPEGLRRDRLHCYDLEMPDDVIPHGCDGEVEQFLLWPAARVVETLRRGDQFKFNVALVLIDFMLRWKLLPESEETQCLTGYFQKTVMDAPPCGPGNKSLFAAFSSDKAGPCPFFEEKQPKRHYSFANLAS